MIAAIYSTLLSEDEMRARRSHCSCWEEIKRTKKGVNCGSSEGFSPALCSHPNQHSVRMKTVNVAILQSLHCISVTVCVRVVHPLIWKRSLTCGELEDNTETHWFLLIFHSALFFFFHMTWLISYLEAHLTFPSVRRFIFSHHRSDPGHRHEGESQKEREVLVFSRAADAKGLLAFSEGGSSRRKQKQLAENWECDKLIKTHTLARKHPHWFHHISIVGGTENNHNTSSTTESELISRKSHAAQG